MLIYRGENTRGCFSSASVKLIPATSCLMAPTTSFRQGFLDCFCRYPDTSPR